MPKLKNVFQVIVVSFMFFIGFETLKPNKVNAVVTITPELAQPNTVNADVIITPALAQFIEIKNYFRDAGFSYKLTQHDPRILLHTKRGNCVAFTMLFQAIATNCGLECQTMCSPDHAYNLVRIDGQWYFVDLCNYAANYTANFVNYCQIYPGHEREISRDLDKYFCNFCLLFSYNKAGLNFGSTSSQFFLPGSYCTFQKNGILYTRDISAPQDVWLCHHCTRDFDWDEYYNPATNGGSPSVHVPPAISSNNNIVISLPQCTELMIMSTTPVSPLPQPRRSSALTTVSSVPYGVPDEATLPVHRVYNGKVHHYTSNFGEVQCLLDLGWTYEQPVFDCFQSAKEGRFEVFRLYNPNDPFGNHLLTINEHEKKQLVEAGWGLEESNGYVEINHKMKRVYNPGTGEHFYTTSDEEVQNALKAGWSLDGTVW